MISPLPHTFLYTFISMKVPLLGIDGMVYAVRFRGGVDHVSKFEIENQIEIQFQMSIELLIQMQPVPHCRAGTRSTHLHQWRECTPVFTMCYGPVWP